MTYKAFDVLFVYDVIRSEPQGYAEKKNLITWCNQNMPALPLSDDLQCGSTITFFSNRSMQRIRVFLSANEPILGRLVSHCWDSLPTFLVMQSRQRWAHLELQKVKMSQTLKSKKKSPLFFCINSDKLETTLAPPPDWTKVYYTSITQKSNIPVVMS